MTKYNTPWNTPWIDSNVIQFGYELPQSPKFILKRLSVKLMNIQELKDNDLVFDYLKNVETVPKNAKIVITNIQIEKEIYDNQYYFQWYVIENLDVKTSSNALVNLVVSGKTISNLQYYNDTSAQTYDLYMYHINSEDEDEFLQFWEKNKSNIMKYTNIHLLELSSYYLVKNLCDYTITNGKNINLYVYDEKDIEILSTIFENNIRIGSNVTIILYIGWFKISETLFLNYMKLILKMTEYKMRNYGEDYYKKSKKFDIVSDKINTEELSKNYLYNDCVSVLLDRFINSDNNTTEDYKACLLALQNLELLNSTTEETNNRITKMNNEYTQLKTQLKTNLETNMKDVNTDIELLEDKYDTNIELLEKKYDDIQRNYALKSDVESKSKSINEEIYKIQRNYTLNTDVELKSINEEIQDTIRQISAEFESMIDIQNTKNSNNTRNVFIVTFIMFFIIIIYIRSTKKNK